MHEIDIDKLDLNLLKVFMAVHEEGTVTAAAERLGVAQSSMSHALGRLRESLGDPLFVRCTNGMRPTPLAAQLVEPVSDALRSLQSVIDRKDAFEPATSTRTFRILMADADELAFLPGLMNELCDSAPGISVVVDRLPRSSYRDALESGDADLALGQLPTRQIGFYQQPLRREQFLCLVPRGHPLLRSPSQQTWLEAAHVVVGSPSLADESVRRALGVRSRQRNVKVIVRSYLAVPSIVAEARLVATLPETFSGCTEHIANIVRITAPFKIPPITIRQFWHERTHRDPGAKWLRRTVARLFR